MWSDGEKGLEEEGPPRNEEITNATGKKTIAVNADQGEKTEREFGGGGEDAAEEHLRDLTCR